MSSPLTISSSNQLKLKELGSTLAARVRLGEEAALVIRAWDCNAATVDRYGSHYAETRARMLATGEHGGVP
jgi:hypothetical protein